jgi:two-component system, chemotaxis family, protein-glutamate methylesterase/glutaminase
LQATHVRDREVLEHCHIYVAPPGQHLIARGGLALLTPTPRVNRHRPAVDVMFASAAEWMAMRTVAVVLSGALDDGAVGAALVAQAGGQVLVQDPAEAEFASMPRSALAAAPGARAVPLSRLAQAVRDSLDVALSLHSDPAPKRLRRSSGAAVTALEEQAAVLRYMRRRASGQRQEALPDQDQSSTAQERYAQEIATRAIALRAQVRKWSSRPPQLDTPPE